MEYEFGNPQKLSPIEKHVEVVKPIPQITAVLDFKSIKIAQQETLMWGTNQQDAIEYGNLVHEILSCVKTEKDVEYALNNAILNGLIINQQKAAIQKSILEIVKHDELKDSFEDGNLVLNEKTVIQKDGKTIKPDRISIRNKNEVVLLDYKTGTHQKKHALQLENYQIAIEKMGYQVVKKTLVYIGQNIQVVNLT